MPNLSDSAHIGNSPAANFLQTAVVIDDRAKILKPEQVAPSAVLSVPDRRTEPSSAAINADGIYDAHDLDAGTLMDAFSDLGIICGVTSPKESAMKAMKKADIVILDWFLEPLSYERTLILIRELLTKSSDRNSLRLISIYTAEPELNQISETLFSLLDSEQLAPERIDATEIKYRHGQIVIYVKPNVNIDSEFHNRIVSAARLPLKLVNDFESMTSGLLPSIALTSLTSVREGAHRVLDQFSSDLDLAFLVHRACLTDPNIAEEQIVNLVADELRGLMDSDVSDKSPAGANAVEAWLRQKYDGIDGVKIGETSVNVDQAIELANSGSGHKATVLSKNKFESLAPVFSAQTAEHAPHDRLAWIMSFRTIHGAPAPILHLGTVISEPSGDCLLCIRPQCDCVRLSGQKIFYFLKMFEHTPSEDSEKFVTARQLVVKIDGNFKRLGFNFQPENWVCKTFEPSDGKGAVVAIKPKSDPNFYFVDATKTRFVWHGELKSEFAQQVAHDLACSLSRVATDESEWLRRISDKPFKVRTI